MAISLDAVIQSWPSSESLKDLTYDKKLFTKEVNEHTSFDTKIYLLRAREVRETLKTTHDVFIHSQTAEEFFVWHLTQQKNENSRHQAPLRAPTDVKMSTFPVFHQHFTSLETKTHGPYLIPVDADFNNIREESSQIYFIENNTNLELEKKYSNPALDRLKNIFISEEAANRVYAKVQEKVKDDNRGIIWAIAIPKVTTSIPESSICYASRAYAEVSKETMKTHAHFLETLKKSQNSDKKLKNAPIYQIIAHGLENCEEAKIVCCAKGKYADYEAKAKDLLAELEKEVAN